jgi:tRNA/rRNA methyltransferase
MNASRPSLDSVRIVLVEPRYDGNLGQVARAMRNFGLQQLVLVAGDADPNSDEARWFARDEAQSVLDQTTRVESLGAAVGDCTLVIGTSRRVGRYRGDPEAPEAVFESTTPWYRTEPLALVFGREAHGLATAELDLCHRIVFIPSDPAGSSLNLAHAVAVLGYGLYRAYLQAAEHPAVPATELHQPASSAQLEGMYQHLRRVWRRIGYLNEQNPDSILRRWRRILGHAPLSVHDINVIRAMAHQTEWVAKLARIPEGGPPEARELFDKHQPLDPPDQPFEDPSGRTEDSRA